MAAINQKYQKAWNSEFQRLRKEAMKKAINTVINEPDPVSYYFDLLKAIEEEHTDDRADTLNLMKALSYFNNYLADSLSAQDRAEELVFNLEQSDKTPESNG